ncbi:MAG: hypothetical protein PHE79_08590 [Eubacteriales bacterium]|nr:hypothetical protein [Eubacteriales bacterium]
MLDLIKKLIGSVGSSLSKSINTATTPSYSGSSYSSGSNKKSNDVAIRDYINSYGKQYGISNSDIGWDNGQVMLGGSPLITPSRISPDNRSYASENDIKSAIDSYAAGRGYIPQGYSEVSSGGSRGATYQSPYSSQINAMLKKLNSTPAFDPNSIYSNPEYTAMKQRLESQSQDTSKNVMADFASMTGGMPSSYAIAAAKEASGDVQNRLNEAVPSLMQTAYNRHLQDQGMTMDQINTLSNMDNSGYQRFADDRNYQRGALESDRAYNQGNKQFEYNASRDQLLDQRWLNQFDYTKKQDALNYGLQSRQVSVAERNAQLARDQAKWAKDPTNPANMKNPETVGAMYSSMFASGDPEKWLKQNAQYLSNDELKALAGYLPDSAQLEVFKLILDKVGKK